MYWKKDEEFHEELGAWWVWDRGTRTWRNSMKVTAGKTMIDIT